MADEQNATDNAGAVSPPVAGAPAARTDPVSRIAAGLAKGGPPPAAGYVSPADVQRLVDEGVKRAVAEQGGRLAKQREDEFAREQFIRRNMADLPDVYADLMPQTGDAKQLADAEQKMRASFRQWYDREVKAGRLRPARDVGGVGTGDGQPPAAVGGPVQRSATQNIAAGLRSQREAGVAPGQVGRG